MLEDLSEGEGAPAGEAPAAALLFFRGHLFAPARQAPAVVIDLEALTLQDALAQFRDTVGPDGQIFGVWDRDGRQIFPEQE